YSFSLLINKRQMDEDFLSKRLAEREAQNALRQLQLPSENVDFCSNDYLGIVRNRLLEAKAGGAFMNYRHGSTGSRLLAGNSLLAEETESFIAAFHDAEA